MSDRRWHADRNPAPVLCWILLHQAHRLIHLTHSTSSIIVSVPLKTSLSHEIELLIRTAFSRQRDQLKNLIVFQGSRSLIVRKQGRLS